MNRTGKHGSWPLLLAIGGIALLLAPSARAVGLGAYFEYGYANGHLDFDDETFGYDIGDLDYDTNRVGAGFVLDTNVARDRLFNYRLNVGYQRSSRHFDGLEDEDSNGLSLNNTFGFGFYRTPQLRLWAGPAVRINVDIFDTGGSEFDVIDYSIGGGLQAGVNFHTGDHFTVSLAVGYGYMYVSKFFDPSDKERSSHSFAGGEHLVNVGISILFRMPGDHFDRPRGPGAKLP
jgi:hypothetical protein